MSDLQIKLDGDFLLTRKLGGLSQDLQGNVGYTAISLGASFLSREIRSAAPVGKTGNLRDSIGYSMTRTGDGWMAKVGARLPQGAHIHLVEKGTTERFTKSGKSTGRMNASPFLVPTYESRRGQVESIIAEELAIGVEARAA